MGPLLIAKIWVMKMGVERLFLDLGLESKEKLVVS